MMWASIHVFDTLTGRIKWNLIKSRINVYALLKRWQGIISMRPSSE